MLKLECDGCGLKSAGLPNVSDENADGWLHRECRAAPGRWREVNEEPLGAVHGHEMQKLREENAALTQSVAALQKANADKANPLLYGAHEQTRQDNQRLRMQAADMSAGIDYTDELLRARTEDLEFCKRELRRLDPRLWAARWGR